MTIHEFLMQFKPEEIVYQRLDESLVGVQSMKSGDSKVTFATNQIRPGDVVLNSAKPCLILWIDRNAWEREKTKKDE